MVSLRFIEVYVHVLLVVKFFRCTLVVKVVTSTLGVAPRADNKKMFLKEFWT